MKRRDTIFGILGAVFGGVCTLLVPVVAAAIGAEPASDPPQQTLVIDSSGMLIEGPALITSSGQVITKETAKHHKGTIKKDCA